MKRLYYLADNLDVVDEVAAALQRNGITGWDFHVMSKDDAGLYRHHLHSATPLHKRDVIRFGERGGIIGLCAGLLLAALIVALLGDLARYPLLAFGVTTVLVTMFGTWAGGMVGLCIENHKVRRFHSEIEAGRYLLMIDTGRAQLDHVRRLMRHYAVTPGGEDSPLVLPFQLHKI